MRTRRSLANTLLVAGFVMLLSALQSLPKPAAAVTLASLTETAEPTVVTATASSVPTNTPLPTATATNTVVPTATATQTSVPTAEPTATSQPAATAEPTLIPTHTPVPTAEPTAALPDEGSPERPAEPSPVASPTIVPPVMMADPAVSKRGGVAVARLGDIVPFTITVTNHGATDAADVVVVDELPAFLELVSASASQGEIVSSPRAARLLLGSVAPGAEIVFEVITRVVGPAQAPDNRNRVNLSSSSITDSLANNSDAAVIEIVEATATPVSATATPDLPTATVVPPAPDITDRESSTAIALAPTTPRSVAEIAPTRLPVTADGPLTEIPWTLVAAFVLLSSGLALRWKA